MKRKESVISTVFILFILIFSAISFLKADISYSENENRYLKQKPALSVETLLNGQYSNDYEVYLSDQFAGRDRWIYIKTMTDRLLLKNQINQVFIGRNHYLIENYSASHFESEQAQKNIRYLEALLNNLKERDLLENMRIMLVPSASEILKDQLPFLAQTYNQTDFLQSVAALIPQAQWIDLTVHLKTHADEYIYYKTDHHWTTLGAFYAYEAWAESMAITAYKRESYTETIVSTDFFGTIQSKLNFAAESDAITIFERDKNQRITMVTDLSQTYDGLYDFKALDKKDQYSMFLYGNHGIYEIDTHQKIPTNRRLLVIKDSYAHSLVPFLTEYYDTICVIDLRYIQIPISQLIEDYAISDILFLYSLNQFVTDTNLYKLPY